MPRSRAAASSQHLRIAASLIAVTLAGAGAAAEPFGYVTGEVPGGGRGLLELDLATGTLTPVGPPFGFPGGFLALAFAPDGTLYGVDDVGRRLLRIDSGTGVAQVVTPLDLTDPVVSLEGLTFDACGRLFATGGLGGAPDFRQVLIELDPVTGAVTELTPPGSEPVPFYVAAREEALFVWTLAGLARIDPASHLPVPVGPMPDELGGPLDFDAEGDLWGYGLLPPGPFPNPPPAVHRIFRIDPATGEPGDPIATLPANHAGLAIAPPAGTCVSGTPLAVPALSPGGIAVLVLSLLALGTYLLRRDGAAAGPTS